MRLSAPVLAALAAAFLFGISTPLAKVLSSALPPLLLAGLLYLGSGLGLALLRAGRERRVSIPPLSARQWRWFGLAIALGGIVAPVLLLSGLQRTSAADASLLLNLESVFTALLAWFLFRENFDRRIALGMAAIVAGGLLNVCEPLFALRVLHGSGSQYAVLVAAYGAGMVAASLLVARRGEAGEGEIIRRYLLSLALIALGLAGTAIVGSIWLALITFAATGYANALMVVSETQLIQARVPNAVQGRLYGMRDAVEGVSFLTGLVGAGALIGAAGVRVTLGTAAALCAACAVAALVALGSSALQSRRGIIARDLGIASDGAAAATSPRRFDPDAAEPVRASRGTPAAPPAVNQSPAGQRGARQPPPWTA